METADELQRDDADVRSDQGARMQAGVYLLELSPDWIVARASGNVGQLLGHSVQTIIDEPLANFVDAQALHDCVRGLERDTRLRVALRPRHAKRSA